LPFYVILTGKNIQYKYIQPTLFTVKFLEEDEMMRI
jgi:hypothetical protein